MAGISNTAGCHVWWRVTAESAETVLTLQTQEVITPMATVAPQALHIVHTLDLCDLLYDL
jgi:hypothetical protein